MTSTDELRKLLDERGVEHDDDYLRLPKDNFNKYTTWGDDDCDSYIEYVDGTVLRIFDCTPEQAISATLGYELNPDGLPAGLTISDDGALLNWRGENYVKQATLGNEINGETSDGYHTFNELYHHRAVLFSVIVENYRDAAWKAKKHHDGTMYDGMFIVGIDTPWGQASYHYDLDPYWDMFDCEEREAAPEWDGHTPDDAIERVGKLATLGGNGYKQAAAYWKRMFEELLTERIGEERDEAATLGGGTCRNEWAESGKFRCSECWLQVDSISTNTTAPIPIKHCPNCGMRVKR